MSRPAIDKTKRFIDRHRVFSAVVAASVAAYALFALVVVSNLRPLGSLLLLVIVGSVGAALGHLLAREYFDKLSEKAQIRDALVRRLRVVMRETIWSLTTRSRQTSGPCQLWTTFRSCAGGASKLLSAEAKIVPASPLKLLNVDLSAVTRSADLVVGLGEPMEEIVHMEFQSAAAAWKHADILVYNALLYSLHHVPVHSVLLLLRPEAAHQNMTGHVHYAPRPEHGKMDFGYRVVRLWETDAERLIAGELGVIPLALLGRFPERAAVEESVAAMARRVVARLAREASPDRAGKLLARALLLAGLRVRRNVALKIFEGVYMMEESDTYLAILDQGEERGIRKMILMQGEDRFGPPDDSVKSALKDITDLDRLIRIGREVLKATSWQDLIA